MKILDLDFQEAISQMNNEELRKIMDEVSLVQGRSEGGITRLFNQIASSSDLKQAIENVCGKDKSEIISDDKAINEENNKENAILYSSLHNSGLSVRMIGKDTLVSLISRAKDINYDKEYSKKFEGMSSDEVNEVMEKLTGNIPPSYQTNDDIIKKYRILEIIKAKAYAKECVFKIPDKKIMKAKEEFESFIEKVGAINISRKNAALTDMMQTVLGQEFDSSKSTSEIQMVDFAEAFEDRAKELETKKKSSIFAKIKNFFMKHTNTKALPEGRGENLQQGEQRKNYLDTLKCETENAKDNTVINEQTMVKNQNLKSLENNDKGR